MQLKETILKYIIMMKVIMIIIMNVVIKLIIVSEVRVESWPENRGFSGLLTESQKLSDLWA